MLIMGAGGMDGVRSQHVSDFPSAGQFRFYIDVPAVALITLALLALPVHLFFYMDGA